MLERRPEQVFVFFERAAGFVGEGPVREPALRDGALEPGGGVAAVVAAVAGCAG